MSRTHSAACCSSLMKIARMSQRHESICMQLEKAMSRLSQGSVLMPEVVDWTSAHQSQQGPEGAPKVNRRKFDQNRGNRHTRA
jgi:hypothetical protein